jgi:hypothetical protein
MIRYGSGFAVLDFTEIHLQHMILDSGDGSLRHFILGFQEWKMQSRHESKIFMIRVAQRHHGGSFLGIAWDPETSWFDNVVVVTDGRVNFYYHEFMYIRYWNGFLGGDPKWDGMSLYNI